MIYTRIAVLEQVGYREWTESLGSDREWLIQETQSHLYHGLQEEAAEIGAFVLPLRYDYMIMLASSLSMGEHERLLRRASSLSPVPVRMASSCALTPLRAEARASSRLRRLAPGTYGYSRCPGPEAIAVAHIDVNNFTFITLSTSTYKAFWHVRKLLLRLHSILARRGGIVSYLGGDNVIAVLPVDEAETMIGEILDEELKAGIGVASRAREALRLAAAALDNIRKSRVKGKRMVSLGGV